MSNRELVQELRNGTRLGCRYLVDRYQKTLLNEAVRAFHIALEDAKEIVSDVLLSVVHGIHKFQFVQSDSDFHWWIMTVLKNRVRDFTRHRARTNSFLEQFEESAGDQHDPPYSPSERNVVREIVRNYQQSLTDESPDDHEARDGGALKIVADTLEEMESWERVLLRCRALDVSYQEIAEYTGKSVKQLKVYHGRVKKKLARMLVERFPDLQVRYRDTKTTGSSRKNQK